MATKPKPIKVVVHTISGWNKTNGYSIHFATVYHVAKGKNQAMFLEAKDRTNIVLLVNRMLGPNWSEVLTIETDAGFRDVRRLLRGPGVKHESFANEELADFLGVKLPADFYK